VDCQFPTSHLLVFLLKKYSLDINFSLANKIKVLAWPFWMQCNTLIIVGLLVEKD